MLIKAGEWQQMNDSMKIELLADRTKRTQEKRARAKALSN